MKRTVNLFLVLMLLVTCTACQPTPEEEIVYNRGDGKLEQAIVATAAPTYAPKEAYEAPEKWEETLEIRGRTVNINAEVIVADTTSYPVITINQNYFTESEALDFFKTMLGDTVEVRQQQRSYDELLEDLLAVERGHYKGEDDDTGEIIFGPYAGQEADIAEIKELLAETSPEETYEPLKNMFPMEAQTALKDAEGNKWYGYWYNRGAQFCAYRRRTIQMESWIIDEGGYPGEEPHALENIKVSLEDAVKMADQWVERLGKGEFVYVSAEKARALEGETYTVLSEGYYLTYVRNVAGGVPLFYDYYHKPFDLNLTQDECNYAPNWQQEHIEIYVTETGVQFFAWADRVNVLNTANENVQLLPFEEIQDRIRKLLTYSLADEMMVAGEPVKDTVLVTKMVLSTAMQQIADQGEEAFMAPTWVVFVTTEKDQKLYIDPGVLLISAIDGSVIWNG